LIGVTAPVVNQFTEAGNASIYSAVGVNVFGDDAPAEAVFKHEICSENSAVVISANSFKPTNDV